MEIWMGRCYDYVTRRSKFVRSCHTFQKRVWLHYVVKIRRPTEIKDKLNVLINIYAPNNDKDITNFLNYPRTILQNENLEDEENIIIAGKINCPPNPALDKKKVVQCYRGNQLLKPLIVYETNLIWLTFENLKSFFKKFHEEQKLANDFIALRLLADFK